MPKVKICLRNNFVPPGRRFSDLYAAPQQLAKLYRYSRGCLTSNHDNVFTLCYPFQSSTNSYFSVKTYLIDKEVLLKEAFWVGAEETMVSEEIKPASYAHHLEEVNEEETSPSSCRNKVHEQSIAEETFFSVIASCVTLTTN